MQVLDKFSRKANWIGKYNTINSKLSFIESFKFVSSFLDSLVENLNNNDFKYLSQEFDNNVLNLVKQKGSYPYELLSDFEMFKEESLGKEIFYCSLTDRKASGKEYEYALNVWGKMEEKRWKIITTSI